MDSKLINFYKNKNILVTGGAGFIGSHLVEELVKLGANVTVLDNLSTGKIENLAAVKNNINFIKEDICNFNACLDISKNKNIIFHLAALVSVPYSMKKPQICHDINITGTFNLLECSRLNKIDRFIFSSSSSVYGNKETICSEDDECAPNSLYGYSKLVGENYCKIYYKLFNLKTICLRYFNVYGPRQDSSNQYSSVIAQFRENLKNNLPLTIYGDGLQTRDFISVDKIVEANLILTMLESLKFNGESINIATGSSINLIELINLLKKDYPNNSSNINFLPARLGDIKISQANCAKFIEYKKIYENLNL